MRHNGEKIHDPDLSLPQGRDESKNPAESYRKDDGIVFTYNGQAQACL
jgi:hypothetical protein